MLDKQLTVEYGTGMDFKQKNENRKLGRKNGGQRDRREARVMRRMAVTDGEYHVPGAFGDVKPEIWNEMIYGTTGKPRT